MINVRTYATADTLNRQVEFDSPFTVLPADEDGNVEITDGPAGVYAPELYDVVNLSDFSSDTWELVNGYSGQDRYAGPIMHDSEYLGGGMARDVLATPGTYVVIAAYYGCTDEEHADGTPVTDDDPRETFTDAAGVVHTYVDHGECESHGEGWALARLRETPARLSPLLITLAERYEDDPRRPTCDADTTLADWLAAMPEAVAAEQARRRIAAGVRDGNLSWSDVAEQSARGWCPASPEGTEPHKVTDDATCDECGAEVRPAWYCEACSGDSRDGRACPCTRHGQHVPIDPS